jgi:hypothetical protein
MKKYQKSKISLYCPFRKIVPGPVTWYLPQTYGKPLTAVV